VGGGGGLGRVGGGVGGGGGGTVYLSDWQDFKGKRIIKDLHDGSRGWFLLYYKRGTWRPDPQYKIGGRVVKWEKFRNIRNVTIMQPNIHKRGRWACARASGGSARGGQIWC